ncbi:MAG TPA: DUF3137 domain-containing protein [Mycobacteriales bacterium]|nr:DUF3137 domain-containing protein [Mycobacteriales bacterium]
MSEQDQWRPNARWYGREFLTRLVGAAFFGIVALQFGSQFFGYDWTPMDWLMHGNRMEIYLICFAAVFVVLLILGGPVLMVQERLRMRRLAAARGWTYVKRADEWERRWQHAPFGEGTSRRVGPAVHGPIGSSAASAFSYRYTTRDGNESTRHHVFVVTMALPGPLPYLRVGPESLRGAVTPGLAAPDVDTENETFNRRYRVVAGDHAFAHAVLTPRVIEALLRIEPFTWQIDGTDLVAAGSLPKVDALQHKLEVLHEIADQIPGYLYRV